MNKVKVSKEVSDALDKIPKDEWNKQFYLIGHCKAYSGNGIRMGTIYTNELKILDELQPLEFAKCLICGYEVESQSKKEVFEWT